MGGLIIRGALPKVFQDLESEGCPELGHYVSLSSPHLGIQASWLAIPHVWRNLCSLTAWLTPQLVQLAVQDIGGVDPPYLVALGDAQGPYLRLLRRFRRRTCVTLATGDCLIPLPSGVIDPERQNAGPSMLDESFWQFDDRSGLTPNSSFELKCQALSDTDCPLKKDVRIMGFLRLLLALVARIASLSNKLLLAKRPSRELLRQSCATLPEPESLGARLTQDCAPSPPSPALASASAWEEEATELTATDGSEGGLREELNWSTSADGSCRFPSEIVEGLNSMPWQRIVTTVHHRPMAANVHVFLIGKPSEQFPTEHQMSRQCIGQLVEVFAD